MPVASVWFRLCRRSKTLNRLYNRMATGNFKMFSRKLCDRLLRIQRRLISKAQIIFTLNNQAIRRRRISRRFSRWLARSFTDRFPCRGSHLSGKMRRRLTATLAAEAARIWR